jgi:Flp pilus assembly protein TadG
MLTRAPLMAQLRRLRLDRRCTAAIEFALVAPIGVTLAFGSYDIVRAYKVWDEVCNAAPMIADSAAKLSLTLGLTATKLSYTQMQNAMSLIYLLVPDIGLGDGTSTTKSSFSVTLSEIIYSPICSTASGCAAQTPYTAWSSYLTQTGVTFSTAPLRACGALTAVTTFPDNSTQLASMVSWKVAAGSGYIPLSPQVVADVRATYVPIFSMFLGTVTFWSSAMVPAPLGTVSQQITFDTTAPTGNVVTCTVP